jgi:putative protease
MEFLMSTLEPNQKRLELLAPAGDWDALLAALAAGADAVYLGGKLFNARQNAANFDLHQLQEATDLLHLHNKKIYITVNTLIAENELPEALEYLCQLYNLGVDAVIVQDLGLIHLAHQYLPDLELHASTQMTIHNLEGALLLKERGLKRVVLARELTAAEIETIAGQSGIEVEVFVHGALCVCYSGQCLMSSMIGGRSGNRGRCAQPCRMEYQLGAEGDQIIQTSGSYLLSPKDIALIHEIPELHRIGVKSLKIEGRMKRPEYVYQVVKTYRQALERYSQNPQGYEVGPGEIRELEQSFNRGFSSGYFGGHRNADIMGFKRPNNRGVYLGRIIHIDGRRGSISLRLEADLEIGDEIEIWISRGGRTAGPVKELIRNGKTATTAKAGETVTLAMDGKAFAGDRVFKIFSIQNDRETKQALDRENSALKIPCTALVTGRLDTPLQVVFSDLQGHSGVADTEAVLQSARNRPLTSEILKEQLGRLGNTPFYLADLTVQVAERVMMPLSELNIVRRRAMECLSADILKKYPKQNVRLGNIKLFNDSPKSLPKKFHRLDLSVWVADYQGVVAAATSGANLIYAGGDELTDFHWDAGNLADAIQMAHRHGARLVIGLPRINREGQRQRWNDYLQMIIQLPADGIMLSDLGSLQRVLDGTELPIYLNYSFNFFNSYALTFLSNPRIRIRQLTLSPELTLEQIREIRRHQPDLELECLVQGPLELMVSEYCPLASTSTSENGCGNRCRQSHYFLRDRMQLDFPIYTDQYCRLHLLNAKDLCLYGDLEKILTVPGLVLRLELKTYHANQVPSFVQSYRNALKAVAENRESAAGDNESVITQFKSLTGRGITKGHYFRGVD